MEISLAVDGLRKDVRGFAVVDEAGLVPLVLRIDCYSSILRNLSLLVNKFKGVEQVLDHRNLVAEIVDLMSDQFPEVSRYMLVPPQGPDVEEAESITDVGVTEH